MAIAARLHRGETLGDRIMKVNHAGEHGAICIYTAQRWFARWRAPSMVAELDHFLEHERRHRAIFQAELQARNRKRCKSFHLCGLGGLLLGAITGMAGKHAIAATTVAIERTVLRHMKEQLAALQDADLAAHGAVAAVIADEQEHHDQSQGHLPQGSRWSAYIDPLVTGSTAAVIFLGMHL